MQSIVPQCVIQYLYIYATIIQFQIHFAIIVQLIIYVKTLYHEPTPTSAKTTKKNNAIETNTHTCNATCATQSKRLIYENQLPPHQHIFELQTHQSLVPNKTKL